MPLGDNHREGGTTLCTCRFVIGRVRWGYLGENKEERGKIWANGVQRGVGRGIKGSSLREQKRRKHKIKEKGDLGGSKEKEVG